MIKEEILFKTSKTGTTAFYFVAGVDNSIIPSLEEPAYVILNALGAPESYHIYASGTTEIWTLRNSNDYLTNVLLTAVTTNFLTGYSVSDTFKKVLSVSEKQLIQERFYNNTVSTITGQTTLPNSFQTYVFFNEHEVDDVFANITLTRSFDTLDTLKVYNKPINSIEQQEAKTGVLFGKLQAIQILKDEVGNNIRIPLRNVPVGIFNSTEEFQAPMSLDENGDRFFMNLLESSTINQYFNVESFTADTKLLKSQAQFLTVPEKFKYITTTNDNGEFVIYNAPIGSQTLVFEVDLFKQGLSKDEIILNNFPFPTNDDSNIGEFPCYYYNQIPVDVIPTWGNNQSGYTEINVNVNLDLRKWSTYIFPPASFGNEKLETTVAKNVANTFKIQVRDMTNNKFAVKSLEIVQIPNDLDRTEGSKYLWFNELLSQRQQIEFFKYGCHVLKLPANLYDPNGYKTDLNGNGTNSRGLWLAAYQFNSFINIDRCRRTTGGLRIGDADSTLNHFDLNNYVGANPGAVAGSGVGRFPYERAWSITYPEPYKITKKPVSQRFDIASGRLNQNPYILEEPPYSDGDLVGNPFNINDELSDEGGFGIQEFNGVHFPNQIAFVATKDYMYKYESEVNYNEQYSNGYEQYWSSTNQGPYTSRPNIIGLSKVDGEKYQRVECGYGYFMKYQDWTRVYRLTNGSDHTLFSDYNNVGTSGPGTYGDYYSLINYRRNMHNIGDQSMAFAFESFLNNRVNTGGIYIYRIVSSGLGNIKIPKNFIIPTYTILHFVGFFNRLYNFQIRNAGVIPAKMTNTTHGILRISSTGALIQPGQTFTLEVNDTFSIDNPSDISYPGIQNPESVVTGSYLALPGNNGYDSTENKYTNANYHFRPTVTTPYGNGNAFHNDNTPVFFDGDVSHDARSSGYVNLKFVSQSDRSEDSGYDENGANLRDGITDSGMNDADNLIDVMLRTF
jgi:hypothetical protein